MKCVFLSQGNKCVTKQCVVSIFVMLLGLSSYHADALERSSTPPVFADASSISSSLGPIARLVRPEGFIDLTLDIPPTPSVETPSDVLLDDCTHKRQHLFVLLNENNFQALFDLLLHMTGCSSAAFKNNDGESLLYCAVRASNFRAVTFFVWCGADVTEIVRGQPLITYCDEENDQGAAIRLFLSDVIELLPTGGSVFDTLYSQLDTEFRQMML